MPRRKNPNNAVLVSIAHSPYCEAARWIMEYAEVPFEEHSFHHGNAKLQTVSWRIQPNLDEATKESEPYIMHLADRGGFPGKAEYALGKKPINRSNIQARSGAVPVVILPDGTYLKDTREIFEYCLNVIGQSPEKFNNIDPIFNGEFFTEYVDFILGTSARCLIYYYTAQKYAPDLSLQQVARLNSNIFFCTFRPGSSDKFKTFEEIATDFETNEYMYRAERSLRTFNLVDAKHANFLRDTMEENIEKFDQKIQSILKNSGGPYLNGKKISLDDIAMAGVYSIIIWPKRELMYDCPEWPLLSQFPKRGQELALNVQNSVSGKLALRVYAECRKLGKRGDMLTDPDYLYPKEDLDRSEKFYMDNAEDESQRLNASSMNTRVALERENKGRDDGNLNATSKM